MKKVAFVLSTAMLLLVAGCQKPATNTANPSTGQMNSPATPTSAYPHRYLVESGIVEYEMSGMQHGTETIYFDQWGWREAKYTNSEISVAGITRKENKFTLMDCDWIYNIDLERRTATKIKTPMLGQFIAAAKNKDQSLTELGEEMLRNMGGQKIGTEAVVGKACDVWETKKLGSKSWVWKGVTLKSELSLGGLQVSRSATRFDENVAIPADKITIPTDVKITEGPDVKRILQGLKK